MEEMQARWHLIAGGQRWQRTRSGGGVGGITSGSRGGENVGHGVLPVRA
jgi:hypothetical protein